MKLLPPVALPGSGEDKLTMTALFYPLFLTLWRRLMTLPLWHNFIDTDSERHIFTIALFYPHYLILTLGSDTSRHSWTCGMSG